MYLNVESKTYFLVLNINDLDSFIQAAASYEFMDYYPHMPLRLMYSLLHVYLGIFLR
jgi:hypothetical protein